MLRTDEILSTIEMLHAEHLDVRTVTLALNVDDCAAPSIEHLCRKLRHSPQVHLAHPPPLKLPPEHASALDKPT